MQTKKNSIDDGVRRTMKCMMIGSSIYNIVLLVVSTIVFILSCNLKNIASKEIIVMAIKNVICVILGYICSLLAIYSMTISVSKSVESNDEKFAKRHLLFSRITRILVFCILFVLIINKNSFGLIGGLLFVLAVFGVKIGAYLAPVIDKGV